MSARRVARPAKPTTKPSWVTLLQFTGSSLGLMGFLSMAFSGLAYAILQPLLFTEPFSVSILLAAAAALWAGLLLLPSAAYSLAQLMNRPLAPPPAIKGNLAALAFLLLPLVILGGAAALGQGLEILLPPVHVLAASLSVLGLVWLGLHGLRLGGPRLTWGALASGLTAAPLLAGLLELLVGFFLLILAGIYLFTQPALAAQLPYIESALPRMQDAEEMLQLVADFVHDPVILGLALAQLALFTPLIEELLKPIAVWLLVWRRPLSNAQGFAIGLLGGAGFALLENLFSANASASWALTASLRFGATAFHIATAGLMGWALVRAKNEGRYLGVFLVYGFNILLHGLWNGVVVLQSFAPHFITGREELGGLALAAITLISLTVLAVMNRKLQAPLTQLARKSRPTQ